MNIVHWGAGKLGLSLGVWDAQCGHDVTFVDVNPATVSAINKGRSPINEPQVQQLLEGNNERISATCGGKDSIERGIVEGADIVFILVPTPSCEDGSFSLRYAKQACEMIGLCLRQKTTYTLVVCVSTIMPGDSRQLIEIIEKASGQGCGPHWGFAYSPEFIRQGSIVHDYANPDVLLVGGYDVQSAHILGSFYATVVRNDPEEFHMSLESAEIAKIGLNAAVVAKTQMANQIAWLCHRTPGADAGRVLESIGADSRIGQAYFGAGTWPGGPCFPRDLGALSASLHERGLPHAFTDAIERFSMTQAALLATAVLNEAPDVIGLLGLSYKPGTALTDESQALLLANLLLAKQPGPRKDRPRVIAYDPDVAVGFSVPSMHELVKQSDVIVLMTPKPEFLRLEEMDLSDKALFDCWGYIRETNARQHITLGVGSSDL